MGEIKKQERNRRFVAYFESVVLSWNCNFNQTKKPVCRLIRTVNLLYFRGQCEKSYLQ